MTWQKIVYGALENLDINSLRHRDFGRTQTQLNALFHGHSTKGNLYTYMHTCVYSLKLIQLPIVETLVSYNTAYDKREVVYFEHNYTDNSDSSL